MDALLYDTRRHINGTGTLPNRLGQNADIKKDRRAGMDFMKVRLVALISFASCPGVERAQGMEVGRGDVGADFA